MLIRIASLYHNLHEMTATAVEKPECTLYCKHFRDEVKMNCDVVSTPSPDESPNDFGKNH
ncbi:hypothetical protein C4M77_19515 [Escherichia coli]|nr:hypothetical protein C4M77_19515 [Escherichia coli]